jgi:hypothetical protein
MSHLVEKILKVRRLSVCASRWPSLNVHGTCVRYMVRQVPHWPPLSLPDRPEYLDIYSTEAFACIAMEV